VLSRIATHNRASQHRPEGLATPPLDSAADMAVKMEGLEITIDHALIQAAVDEWLRGEGLSTSDVDSCEDASTEAHESEWHQSADEVISLPAKQKKLNSAPSQQHSSITGTLDRVLIRVIKQQVLSKHEIQHWMRERGCAQWPDWRTVCSWAPEHAHTIERAAAAEFGYRPVLICQVSTLVLADTLARRMNKEVWQTMVENAIIPVVEHGKKPDPERVVCVTNDPSSNRTAAIIESIRAFRPDLAYADAHHVRAMIAMLSPRQP
jgi:hypothetical protein